MVVLGNRVRWIGVFSLLLIAPALIQSSLAGQALPDCKDKNKILDVMNDEVLDWKQNTDNQFKARARVEGTVVRLFPDRNSHEHFEIQIGPNEEDVLEVVYNVAFGVLPQTIAIGTQVEACGDYITSIAQSGPYPPSPSGAIIHWIHKNPRNQGHDHGYLALDGELYGWMDDTRRGGRGNTNPRNYENPFHFLLDGLTQAVQQ